MSHSLYALNELAEVLHAKLFAGLPGHPGISFLITDSRKVVGADASLFFAIRGDRRDGHEFLAELYESGVRNFVISKKEAMLPGVEANYLLVQDALKALQTLAAWHRKQFSVPVLGVTGSNGKTIVKEWLYQLLRENYHIVRSPKSYNSQIGVPLSVWQMASEDNFCIFEAGISMPGEMQELEKIIQPTIGIFTNIGSAHDENFADTREKIREKMKLFTRVSKLIYCRDYAGIHEVVQSGEVLQPGVSVFTWSKKSKADLQVGRINRKEHETEVQAIYRNNFIGIRIPFTDDASIENALHCWALLLYLDMDPDEIARRMELLSPVAMRLEMKEGINNCSVINDSYNSDLGSLTIALDFMNQQKQHRRRSVILSDILQSGKDEAQLYRQVAELLQQKGVNRLIGIGPALSRQQDQFMSEKQFFQDTADFLRELNYGAFSNETILIKGARSFGFERISRALQQKAHETVLEINLNAVVHNLNLFKSRLKADTKLMVMVKAFSYGSGSFEIANVLQFHRADYLAVAYADEGVELRKAGITLPIMVMNPEEQSFDAMISYKLEPEVYSFRVLNHFTEALRRRGNDTATGRFPVHLELDTGMKRLGFDEQELNELIVRLKNNKYIRIASVFSHLVASDEAEHDAFTRQQISTFGSMSASVASHFNYPILRHLLNSSGILRFPEAQFDMVRLGIGLHGIAATPHEQRQLQMVSTLKTTISQIRQVKAGETIGYSRKGVAQKDMTIATVGIGYADGLSRRLGNGTGKMLVLGQAAPVVGSVCMDMTMIDITGIPAAREGTEVVVFGASPSIIDIARETGTIPYEVLTGISERVKRVYFHE
ncbi:MAG: bifunctional UDP-N-acetylmuramoyl-tripeptide:D-alanyl-D-alanine ligase/alanine racemase [Bacteroidia bacterium]|nr:bifunctional UDP-N-acetylmuramoyl-tripeptide:D-alanyl-D-alanine ligase/alanine racemase [Bacteroidia bacterium]